VQDWITLEEARNRPGLRLVLTAGVPGPWGESAKNLLHAKGLDYARAPQIPGESEDALRAWTAQTSAPILVYEDERPRSSWVEILYQVERLGPEPRLIPEDPEDRVRMLGLCHEVCGDQGFGWQRRLMLLHPMLSSGAGTGVPELLGAKYGYSPETGAAAPQRSAEILRTLSRQLLAQREAGRSYFVGEQLTALDLYWAAFAAMIEPLPAEQCAMPGGLRAAYTLVDPEVRKAADPVLLEHRDAIYRNHLELPLDL
jgi:glutathione S-transferase